MTFRKRSKYVPPGAPLMHADHPRPVTRRDLLRQGFIGGVGSAFIPSALNLFSPAAHATVAGDIEALAPGCTLGTESLRKVPLICFDLAGGANFAGSNVLVGTSGGQRAFLTTAGYNKLGLPGDQVPNGDDFIDTTLGLEFHSDSQLLAGILSKFTTNTTNTNGFVIPARSDNDTGNNPHNPMYGIARYTMAQNGVFNPDNMQSWGQLMALIGSRSSVSGGNSMAPADLIVSSLQPTKVDRASDARGLINTGSLMSLFNQDTAVAAQVLEAMTRLSDDKLAKIQLLSDNAANENLKDMIRCGYVKASDIAASFSSPDILDPTKDVRIVGGTDPDTGMSYDAIFSENEMGNREFQKTASIMKLVLEGRAGAGTITMGGYDYHTGDRATGEERDERAGRCMGACLEYAARMGVPLMMYVFSDGSVASNGMIDDSVGGRGKGVWTGDNSSTACSFVLVYNPISKPEIAGTDPEHRQLGFMRSDASVDTSSSRAANNVNLLVDTVVLNYMALHGDQGQFNGLFGNTLGNIDDSIKLAPLDYNFAG